MSEKIPLVNVLPTANTELPTRKGALSSKSKLSGNKFGELINAGKIYTKRTSGYFQKLRKIFSYLLLTLFFMLPWITITEQPAVYFDLSAQKFHILGQTFWPQDAGFLVYLLVLACILLIAATLVIGRAWCGFVCPQTVWTFLFMWVEDKCEGDRNQRIKLDKQSLNASKLGKKAAKHSLWILISLITAYTFVGYFYPIKSLVTDTFSFNMHYLGVFWLIFFVLGTYLNAGWLREKVCLHMCPYARFQAVMYTQDTLVISYDAERGENRGRRKANTDTQALGLGDCVDCSVCVQVCPVDIDIRDGMQYPCIDCGLCADACDQVMTKMGYATGLIRFASASDPQRQKSFIRTPKVVLLGLFSFILTSAFAYSIYTREALSIDVIRDRGTQLFQSRDGGIENTYQVNINNKSSQTESFILSLESEQPFEIRGSKSIYVPKGRVDTLLVRVWIDERDIERYRSDIRFVVKPKTLNNKEQAAIAKQLSSFIAPVGVYK